ANAMPTARPYLTAATGSDGNIYAIGGFTGSKNTLATVEAYAPTTSTWVTPSPASLPMGSYELTSVTPPGGVIYAIGGANSAGNKYLANVQVYSIATGTWTAGIPMPTGRSGPAAAIGSDGRIYVMGGFSPGPGGNYYVIVEAYSIALGTWDT